MLSTYSITNQTVTANDNISFNKNLVSTCCSIQHTAGTETITISRAGYYLVEFNATGTATATTTNPIIVQLMNGEAEVPGAVSSSLSAGVATPVALSFSTIVRVPPSCKIVDNTATLTVQSQGVDAIYSNANLIITRLQ